MANDQSTTAVPAPAKPQTPETVTATQPPAPSTSAAPTTATPSEHTVPAPVGLPDLATLIDATSEPIVEPAPSTTKSADPGDPLGVIISRP